MSDRLTYYRRWKLGEDPHALAKEAGVTRERMRHMLAKMDAEVPLVDQIAAAEARITELERALRRLEYYLDADQEILDAMDENERRAHLEILAITRAVLKGNE